MAKRTKKQSTPAPATSLRIERVPVSKIKPARYNPRRALQPGDDEYESIKRSLEKFGCVDSLVWNKRTGNLVAGHQRFRILMDEFGATELDVSVVDLPLGDEKALNLALNHLSGDWDDAALLSLLSELQEADAVEVTGFTGDDLMALHARLELEEEGGGPAGDGSDAAMVSESFKVVATCVDAKQQQEVVKTLHRKGVACHLLTRDP